MQSHSYLHSKELNLNHAKRFLNELIGIKNILAQLVGNSDLLPEKQFSKDELDKASKAYQKLLIERGE